MERNALLAVVLSLLILVLWNEFVVKQYAPPPAPVDSETLPQRDPRSIDPQPQAPTAPSAPEAPGAPERVTAQPATAAGIGGSDVVVESDLFRAVFTTLGARLKSLELKNYRANIRENSAAQNLVNTLPGATLPLGVHLRGGTESKDDASVLYEASAKSRSVSGSQSETIEFVGSLGGAQITKRFEITGDVYLWRATVEVSNPPAFASEIGITWDGSLEDAGRYGSTDTSAAFPFNNILALEDDTLQTNARSDLIIDAENAGASFNGPTEWIGFSGQYFFSGLISGGEPSDQHVRAWAGNKDNRVRAMMRFVGQTERAELLIYTGPKDIDLLEASGHSLRRALDLGWFTVVALPMLQFLRFLYQFTGNYGVNIILLTILIKILFYPLTKKSFQSMKAMQKLQPRMERLKENYKDKPDELNKAVMEMYREEGVNPLGGCLPMFLQIPVFVGLYNALLNAVELRHAPFAGWIQDLAAPDRLGSMQLPFVTGAGIPILTLIMGASMLIQQKMTPTTTADPMQQRMMMLMPVVFTFMFINFPAGLVLYWLVNNILTIGQQYMINRQQDA